MRARPGDLVLVTEEMRSYMRGGDTGVTWAPRMDRCIGLVGVVIATDTGAASYSLVQTPPMSGTRPTDSQFYLPSHLLTPVFPNDVPKRNMRALNVLMGIWGPDGQTHMAGDIVQFRDVAHLRNTSDALGGAERMSQLVDLEPWDTNAGAIILGPWRDTLGKSDAILKHHGQTVARIICAADPRLVTSKLKWVSVYVVLVEDMMTMATYEQALTRRMLEDEDIPDLRTLVARSDMHDIIERELADDADDNS